MKGEPVKFDRAHSPQITISISHDQPPCIWPRSSVGRATVIYSGGVGSNSTGVTDFFSLCGPISFLGIRRYYLEYLLDLLEHFNLQYLNHYLIVLSGQTLLVTLFLCLQFSKHWSVRVPLITLSYTARKIGSAHVC